MIDFTRTAIIMDAVVRSRSRRISDIEVGDSPRQWRREKNQRRDKYIIQIRH